MKKIEKIVAHWQTSLCKSVDLGGLIARDPIAHKWKATYRIIVLRELSFWRVTDLINQMVILSKGKHTLGAVE